MTNSLSPERKRQLTDRLVIQQAPLHRDELRDLQAAVDKELKDTIARLNSLCADGDEEPRKRLVRIVYDLG